MGLFSRNKDKPAWLDQTREFCRAPNIVIAGWGPRALVVEAKSPDRSKEIATLLVKLGFQVVPDERMITQDF
jgi:hypothetical protein